MGRRARSSSTETRGRHTRATVFYCPHSEDYVHHEGKGCSFQGTRLELQEHLEVCVHEASEVRHLAESIATFLRRHPAQAADCATLVRQTVERLKAGNLDQCTIKVDDLDDGKMRSVKVRGVLVEPLRRRFAELMHSPGEVDELWSKFLKQCLPGFRPPRIVYHRVRGEHVVSDMLEAVLRADEGEQDCCGYARDQHSYRVWCLAVAAASAAAEITSQMGLVGSPKAASHAKALSKVASKVLLAAGVGSESGGALLKILRAFKSWDADGNGSISRSELASVFSDCNISSDELEKMLVAADLNRDSAIDYAELVAWLYNCETDNGQTDLLT